MTATTTAGTALNNEHASAMPGPTTAPIASYSSVNPPSINLIPTTLRWGAIFGGAVASLGIAMMLYALGLALGLSFLDANDPASIRPSSIFSAIWLVVVSLIALFVGGYVASRGAGTPSRGFGALHGLVMWGLSVIASVWLLGQVASAAVSGGVAVGKAAAEVTGNMMPANRMGEAMRSGLTSDSMLEPINRKLRESGHPTVTASQLESATRDALARAAYDGRLDRESLISALTSNTELSRSDAEQLARDAEARLQTSKARVDRELDRAGGAALAAAEESSKAFWALFGALLFGMLSAVAGAFVGADQHRPKRAAVQSSPSI